MLNYKAGREALQAIREVRRDNLRFLVNKHGGAGQMAALLGYKNKSYLYQLISPKPIRGVSETLARAIEAKLGLSAGWLDIRS